MDKFKNEEETSGANVKGKICETLTFEKEFPEEVKRLKKYRYQRLVTPRTVLSRELRRPLTPVNPNTNYATKGNGISKIEKPKNFTSVEGKISKVSAPFKETIISHNMLKDNTIDSKESSCSKMDLDKISFKPAFRSTPLKAKPKSGAQHEAKVDAKPGTSNSSTKKFLPNSGE